MNVKLRPALLLLATAGFLATASCEPAPVLPEPQPIDPQVVQDQDDMTWEDYRPIPGHDWADRSLEPERPFRVALIAMDFPDQPFVITQPKESDPFGNPQVGPVEREDVAQFYADFFLEPSELNHGQTINGYWMEQSRGKFGITEVDAYGPYRMPEPLWKYGLNEFGQDMSTPDGSEAELRMEPHVDSMWLTEYPQFAEERDDPDDRLRPNDEYDEILRIYAGYDETTVWQEFGEMKFETRDDITPEWGNPNPEMPRWVPTRYVEWTSWLAGAQQWGQASIRQGESSGTITHELGHSAFGIPDLNNNPYVEPYRRVAAGPWDMMDRGSFNGPGGPHMRWVVPPIRGAAMPAGLMLRNRMETGFVTEDEVLTLSREGLARTGLVVADVTARAVDPLPGTYAGIVVRLDGAEPHDRTSPDDPATNPLSPGIPNYDAYSLEVVQRMGYDSFTPDDGVLLAKTKDSLRGRNGGPNGFNSFIWVIDAHPEDIDMIDYVRPGSGEPVMRTIADYRQLNDALFHAGLDSGGEFEWVDEPNRLHFYVVDLGRDERDIRRYTLAVRSLDGSGPAERGVALEPPQDAAPEIESPHTPLTFTIRNTGSAAAPGPGGAGVATDSGAVDSEAVDSAGGAGEVEGADPVPLDDVRPHLGSDLYRLSVTVDGKGWEVRLLNALAAVEAGASREVPVYVSPLPGAGAAEMATVTLTATSESDPAVSDAASWEVRR